MRCTNLMSANGVCGSSISHTRARQGAGVCVQRSRDRDFESVVFETTSSVLLLFGLLTKDTSVRRYHIEEEFGRHRSLLRAWRGVRVVLRQRLKQRLQLPLKPLLLLARLAAHVQRALLVLQCPHLGV